MFYSRFRVAKRGLLAMAATVVGLMALSPGAMARNAYVTNSGDNTVSVIDTATNTVSATIPVGAKPVDVALLPDASRAYVVEMEAGAVSVIDTATNTVSATIPVGTEPRGIAVSPDGAHAYVSNSGDGTVSLIDTGANAVVGPIAVGKEPDGIAVSPDGTRAFVAQRSGNVSLIDTATNTVVGSVPDASAPSRLAIGPRGGRGFVTDSGASSVTAFNPANGSVVGAITVGSQPAGIAIEDSGSVAYAASPTDSTVSAIDTSLSSPLSPALGGFPGATGVAIEPGGLRGLVTDGTGTSVTILDTTRNVVGGVIGGVGTAPTGVALAPDQGPHASFFVSPAKRRAKKRLTFHGSGSTDPDSQIATYAWDFGDGKHVEGSAATRVHRYRKPGTYTVTLSVTDSEGCSTGQVYTGQTASCNGSAAATTTEAISVVDTRGPVLRLAGGKRQRLRGAVNVFAVCPREPCTFRARGAVVTVIKRRNRTLRRRLRMGRAIAAAPAGGWVRMRLRLPRRTRRAVLRALRRRGRATAKLAVIARDEVGDQTLHKRSAELIWPRPRRR